MSSSITSRRTFLASALAASALPFGCGGGANESSEPKQWNVVWIIADDLSCDLGCYGYPSVSTPNIDRLASEGAIFTNAFVTAPVCSPSRSAMLTGMYQTSIGAQNHRSHRDDDYRLPDPVRPLTDYFREAGYYTANNHPGTDKPGKTDYNFNFEAGYQPFDGNDWADRKPGQPFYAQVNISDPHRGRPPDIWSYTDELPADRKVNPDDVVMPSYYPDDPVMRRDWAGYLDAVELLDDKVGEVLKRLEDEGVADSTVVFFYGDHGRPMPRDKQFLYDGGIQIPLVIRWPGKLEPGSKRDELVSSIDFAATSLAIAGITPPDYMEGRVFLGDNPAPSPEYVFAARDRCDETVDRIRAVRSKQYKYIRNYMPDRPYMQLNRYKEISYPSWRLLKRLHKQGKLTPAQELFLADTRPEEELYDVIADPDEVHNLAGDPKHQEILDRMGTVLNLWIQKTGDKGEIPEDPAIAKVLGPADDQGLPRPLPGHRKARRPLVRLGGYRRSRL